MYCVCEHTCVHVCACMFACVHVHVCVGVHICACAHLCVRTHVCACAGVCGMPVCVRVHMCSQALVYMCTCTRHRRHALLLIPPPHPHDHARWTGHCYYRSRDRAAAIPFPQASRETTVAVAMGWTHTAITRFLFLSQDEGSERDTRNLASTPPHTCQPWSLPLPLVHTPASPQKLSSASLFQGWSYAPAGRLGGFGG